MRTVRPEVLVVVWGILAAVAVPVLFVASLTQECHASCQWWRLGDGNCDAACNAPACSFDEGDCAECAPGCEPSMVGNLGCDAACDNRDCGYDGGDCLRSKSCAQAQLECTSNNRTGSSNTCGRTLQQAVLLCGNGTHPPTYLARGFAFQSACYESRLSTVVGDAWSFLLFRRVLSLCQDEINEQALFDEGTAFLLHAQFRGTHRRVFVGSADDTKVAEDKGMRDEEDASFWLSFSFHVDYPEQAALLLGHQGGGAGRNLTRHDGNGTRSTADDVCGKGSTTRCTFPFTYEGITWTSCTNRSNPHPHPHPSTLHPHPHPLLSPSPSPSPFTLHPPLSPFTLTLTLTLDHHMYTQL
jgi:hypothetical protein